MLYLFDKDDNFLNIITKETGVVGTWFKDYENHIPDDSFVFHVDSKSELLQHIVEENQVAFYDRDNDLRLMRIKEIYEITTKEESGVRVKCEPSFLELYDHFVEDRRVTDGTAQTALDRVLDGSRYVGEVTVELGNATDNFYWINGIDSIFKILSTWGGVLKDTITLNNENEIVERKIWIIQRLGSDNGLIVEPDYNAEQIGRKSLSYTKTALWAQGASLETDEGGYTRYITFEDVEWKVADGDPVDKPLGQKWVGDPQALESDGLLYDGVRNHKFGHYNNFDIEDPEELLWATWNELQDRKLKEVIHEAMIYESDKKISLGDTVTVLNRKYNKPIELQSQITGLEYDILDPNEEIKIIVGKYIDMNDDPLQKEVDDIKDDIKKPRPTKPIDNDSFPDIKPNRPENVKAEGYFKIIAVSWDYDYSVYVSHYEVYGSQIKDFVPDSQYLLWRGDVSGYNHEVETGQTWYYYVRAVNTHGTVSEFSEQVSGFSRQIELPDIEDIVPDFLELNIIRSEEMPEGTDFHQGQIWEKLNPPNGPNYWYRWDVLAERWLPISATNLKDYGIDYESDIENIIESIAEKADLEWVDGKLVDKVNKGDVYIKSEIDGMFENVVSVTRYETDIDGIVKELESQESLISQNAEEIRSKVSRDEYEAGYGNLIERFERNESIIEQTAELISQRVTKVEFNRATGELAESISRIEQTAERITQEVSEVRSDLDGLEYENRNLITANSVGGRYSTDGNYKYVLLGNNGNVSLPEELFEVDTNYVISFKIRKISGTVHSLGGHAQVAVSDTTKIYRNGELIREGSWSSSGQEYPDDNRTYEYVIKFKTESVFDGNNPTWHIQPNRLNYTDDFEVEVWDWKLEKGNKATDWSPAPEDIDLEFEKIQTRFEQTANEIALRATREELDVANSIFSEAISELQIRADGITQTVGEVRADLDSLDIPNRNLANIRSFNKEPVEGFEFEVTNNANADLVDRVLFLGMGKLLESSQQYTLSLKYRITVKSVFGVAERRFGGGGPPLASLLVSGEIYLDGERISNRARDWAEGGIEIPDTPVDRAVEVVMHFTTPGTIPEDAVGQIQFNLLYSGLGRDFETIRVWDIKLEKGVEQTPWQPAPEDGISPGDLYNSIDSLQTQIDQNAEAITLRATKTEIDNVNNRISDAVAEIAIHADEISQRVAKNGVMSAIRQTPEQILMQAERIDFGDGSLIVQGGNVYIKNEIIVDSMIARNARIDFAKIANVEITNAMIRSLNVDKLTGSIASFTQRGFNEVTSEVQVNGSGLETYLSGQRTSRLSGSGHRFYRDNYEVGEIGTNWLRQYPNLRGLSFNLENEAHYMSWSHRESASDDFYTIKLAWYKNNQTSDDKGFNFYDDIKISSLNTVKLRKLSTVNYSEGNREIELQNATWDGVAGVNIRRGNDGTRLFLARSRAALIDSGNAYIQVRSDSSGNRVESIDVYNRTYTSSTQMMRVTNNGIFGRSTSSRRYKLLEEPIPIEYAKRIEKLDVVSWFDKRSAEDYAKTLSGGGYTEKQKIVRLPGVIAEDVHNVGLEMFVDYDEHGRPNSVSSNLPLLLLPVYKAFKQETENKLEWLKIEHQYLKQRVNKLEEMIS